MTQTKPTELHPSDSTSEGWIFSSLHHSTPRWVLLSLLVVSGGLAAWGALPIADHMTHRVLFRVHDVPWSHWWGPFQMPAPMNAWGVRPFSVLLLKGYAEIWGPDHVPPVSLLWCKTIFSLGCFALAAAHWLRVHGLGRWSIPVMFSSILLTPSLFTSWYLPELDNLGAAALLWGTAELSRPGTRLRPSWWVIGVLVFGAFLKESSGLLALGLFSAGIIIHRFQKQSQLWKRHLIAALSTLIGWILLTLPMMMARESMAAQETLWGKIQAVEHNSAQLVYLMGSAGVALLALGTLLPRLDQKVRMPVVAAVLAGLLFAPLLVFYTHYEAIYYGHRPMASILVVALWSALIWGVIRVLRALRIGDSVSDRSLGLCWCGLAVAGIFGSITLAVLISPTAREDMASRIFIICAPMLHATALEGASRAWSSLSACRRSIRAGLLLPIVGSFAWYPLASCFNFGTDWHALHPVDQEGRSQLVASGIEGRVILFNHYVQWMGHYEMRALGAPDTIRDGTHFAQVYAWLGNETFPDSDWGAGLLELEEGYQSNVPMDLYWLTRRSLMTDAVNDELRGDLSWTRRPAGLFTPIDWNPVDTPDAEQRSVDLPEHNRPEDIRMTRYGSSPTPLEELALERGEVRWERSRNYYQIPFNLLEIPRRLMTGIPIWEPHIYEARHYDLGPREGEEIGEISDILTEMEAPPPPEFPPPGAHAPGAGPPPGEMRTGGQGGGPPPGSRQMNGR